MIFKIKENIMDISIIATNLSPLYKLLPCTLSARFALFDRRRLINPSDAQFLVMAAIMNVIKGNS